MSSNEDDYNDQDSSALQGLKKRRIQRACDICRRKKIRCDGVQMPGNRCSNCIACNFDCTYVEAAKKRGPPKGYVESLENRLEKLEKLLRRLCPDENTLRELDIAIDKETFPLDKPPVDPSPLVTSAHKHPQDPGSHPRSVVDIATSIIRNYGTTPANSDERFRDDAHLILADNLSKLKLEPKEYRFFGKSSGAMLIQTAIELKHEYAGKISPAPRLPLLGLRRNEFWTSHPWEEALIASEPRSQYSFPEPTLLNALIDLYFEHVNLYLPLLHRPTFERSIKEGLYLQDDMCGAVVLLVCAIGSRFSDDPRVLLDGVDNRHSSGWKWFEQVQMMKKGFLSPPTLYDLQFYCLSVQFLQGSSAPQACWTMVGVGLRLAQDVGAHRKRKSKDPTTVEDELWKRAFWVLAWLDRAVSAALGRPCAIHDEDFDVDLPIDCDDEYWEHPDPEQRWKQPPGKPSLITAFLCYLKLSQVLAFSLRTIYSINKSKILLGFVGNQWEQHIVAELDSALNHFVDTVPDHLRWDPKREDIKFFNQSVVLWSTYYHIQILIHRPFIPSPSKPSPLSFPSLAICTNAARSCIHVVHIQYRRLPATSSQVLMPVFTSGIVLLLSIWGGKKSGLSTDPNKEMADVHKCMAVLKDSEDRWHSAGRLWDILYELASVGELPLPQSTPPSNKRERDADSPISSASNSESTRTTPLSDGPRALAGSKRVNKEVNGIAMNRVPQQCRPMPIIQHPTALPAEFQETVMLDQSSPMIQTQHTPQQELFTLPMYSDELGRTWHGHVKFPTQAQAASSSLAHGAHSSTHMPHTSTIDNSGFWYSFDSLSGDSQLSSSGSVGPTAGTGPVGAGDGFISSGVDVGMVGSAAEQSEADFIFGQLAMGYPAPFSADLQPTTLPMFNGMLAHHAMSGGGQQVGSELGTHQYRIQHEMIEQRFDTDIGVGLPRMTGGGTGDGAPAPQMHQHGFMDNDTLSMWSTTPTGFE